MVDRINRALSFGICVCEMALFLILFPAVLVCVWIADDLNERFEE